MKTSPVTNPEAYGDYLKGRYFYNKLTEDDLHKSVAYFEAALAQDPGVRWRMPDWQIHTACLRC